MYSGAFTFLVDCYPVYAASALAANSFARSSFAAAFPLFGVQMYESELLLHSLGYMNEVENGRSVEIIESLRESLSDLRRSLLPFRGP